MKMLIRPVIAVALAVVVVAALGVRAVAAPPPAAPVAGTAGKPAASPVPAAVAALLKEYQSVMKEKKGEGLREKCDYFTTSPAEGLTPEVILVALERPVTTDPRADAYVKWQLLSGVQGKFPDALKARAIQVYRRAPVPQAHPGMGHADLDRKLSRIGVMKSEAEMPINKEFGDAINAYRAQIEPILEYRDELLARLPDSYDTYVAALSDVYDRVSRGAPANGMWTTLSGAIRAWALTCDSAAQMRQLAAAVTKIEATVKDERYRPYNRVIWTKNDSYTGLKWNAEGTITNDKAITELSEYLLEHAKNPASGGLKFKDDK
jgi:hypothetical protein